MSSVYNFTLKLTVCDLCRHELLQCGRDGDTVVGGFDCSFDDSVFRGF